MITREFIPVGQGTFYKETIDAEENDSICIVYDCGSLSAGHDSLLKERITSAFPKIDGRAQTIDALFISHFDDDHINGVKYLLDNCNVKKIFIPYLTQLEHCMRLLNNIYLSERIDSYVEVIDRLKRFEGNIYQIDVFEQLEKYEAVFTGKNVHPCSRNLVKEISDGKICEKQWEIIPYNYCNITTLNEFAKALKKILGLDLFEISRRLTTGSVQLTKKEIKEFKSAYKVVLGKKKMNFSTMILFSGIREKINDQQIILPVQKQKTEKKWPLGCLYTGDFPFRNKSACADFYEYYKDYVKFIGCLQIPHHGSRGDYKHCFGTHDSIKIISARLSARFPSKYVLTSLVSNQSPYFIVCICKSSKVVLQADYTI